MQFSHYGRAFLGELVIMKLVLVFLSHLIGIEPLELFVASVLDALLVCARYGLGVVGRLLHAEYVAFEAVASRHVLPFSLVFGFVALGVA